MHTSSAFSHRALLSTDISLVNPTSIDGLEAFFDDEAFPAPGLTVKQASLHLDLPLKKLKKRIKSGEIPAIKLGLSDKCDDWRVFPDGVPGAFSAAALVYDQPSKVKNKPTESEDSEPKPKAKRREELSAIEGEVASLRSDVTMLESRLNQALDTIAYMSYETDTLKQLMGQVGITTSWLNAKMLEVQLDRKAIEQFPSTAMIEANVFDNEVTTTIKKAEGTPASSWVKKAVRWVKNKL